MCMLGVLLGAVREATAVCMRNRDNRFILFQATQPAAGTDSHKVCQHDQLVEPFLRGGVIELRGLRAKWC